MGATPTLSGTAVVGSTLTVRPGAWTSSTSRSYQWLADGAPISRATGISHKVTSAQQDKRISVRVTGTRSGFESATRTSAQTLRVTAASTPTISGAVYAGAELTARPGSWSKGAKLSYQWSADGAAIKGATRSSYTISSGHQGRGISVTVTGRQTGYTTVSRTSASTARVTVAARPKISGSAAVGTTLTAKPGTWTSGTSRSYRWYADGRAISGATRSTFTPSTVHQGQRITVQVTGKRSGYATASRTSAATLKVARASTPRVSGSAVTGKTVSASVGSWTPSTSFSYQWRANGKTIKGATSRTYKVSTAQQGKRLSVRVTGKKSGHTTLSRTSGSTSAVKKATSVKITSSSFHCPKGYPIKGNADSGIYHVPSGQYYSRTKPEECFATEAAARNAGYRKSKR